MNTDSYVTRSSKADAQPEDGKPPPPFSSVRSQVARNPAAPSPEYQHSAVRVLPDPAICRAKSIGLTDYSECLVRRPFDCQFALGFGYGFFCRHPRRSGISNQ